MRLQSSTDYAIKILQHLHSHEGDLQKAEEIAASVGTTYPFVTQITHRLKKNDLLRTAQGRHGGYILGKPACEISIYDVFRAMEGELQIRNYLQEGASTGGPVNGGKLEAFLQRFQDSIIAEMSSKSIADLRCPAPKGIVCHEHAS